MEDEDDAKKIIELLDELKELKEENNQFYDSKDIEYFNEYDFLSTIKLIKSNPEYSLSKWKIIFNNLINFNDFIFHLKDKKDLLEEDRIYLLNNKNISSNGFIQENSSNSSSSNNNNSASEDKNKYSSSCKDTNNNELSQTKIELYEFKLNYVSQYLNITENEKMDGESFVKYARKTFYTLLLLLKIDYYEIFNPKKILLKRIKEVLQEKNKHIFLKIKEETFKIDVVINKLAKNDFKKLLDKFPNHFFFIDQIRLEEIKDHEFNLFSEICRDLVNQAEDKYKQEKIYISIFNFLKEIKSESVLENIKEKYKDILNSISLKDEQKENIFMFMTNGSYFLLKFIVNIVSDIFKQNIDNDKSKIKNLINEKIKEFNTTSIDNIIKNKKTKIIEIIYQFYLIFYELRKRQIKHCLFYIGEDSGNEYENNLSKYMTFKKYNNKTDLEKEQKKFQKDFTINNKIKDKIKELFEIQNNFKKVLEKFGLTLYKELCENEKKKGNEIANLLNQISLGPKDLISLLFFINKDDSKNGEKFLQPLKDIKKFDIKVEYYEKQFDFEQIENLKNKVYDIAIIVAKPEYAPFLNLILFKKNIQNFCIFPLNVDIIQLAKNTFKAPLVYNNLLKKKYYNIKPEVPKNSYIHSEILNFKNLSNKISEELKAKIDIEKNNTLLSFSIDGKEKDNFLTQILNNFKEVNNYFKRNVDEKEIETLKKINEEQFKILNENLKASIFYDFIYYSLLPEKKYNIAEDYYSEYLS